MKIRCFIIIFAMSSLLHSEENFGIVVHGGAGVLSGLSIERQQEIENKVKETFEIKKDDIEKNLFERLNGFSDIIQEFFLSPSKLSFKEYNSLKILDTKNI